jgi:hypothetical protein
VSAVIDLLIKAGHEESEATQMIMRRLVATGVPAPEKGGDAGGWKRCGVASRDAEEEYRDFAREIDAIPANERVKRVMDEHLWDRRRKPG